MNDLDAARKRISDLGDEKARLQGLYAGALNRIQELEDERKALREGLADFLPFCVRLHKLAIQAVSFKGATTDDDHEIQSLRSAACDGEFKEALAAAALLGKGEPTIAEMSGLVEDFTGGVPLKEHLDALRGSDDAPSSAAATIPEAIRKMMANPELLERYNNLTADEARELLSSNPDHWGTADRQTMPSPTERPIQVGDAVRHKTQGWEKTVKRILPALPEKSLAVMALFDGGDRYPLSELERVEAAEPEHGEGKSDGQKD